MEWKDGGEMLEQVLIHLRNWFVVPDGIHQGTYTIRDGRIALPFLMDKQYYRITGSVFNDGLHQYWRGAVLLRDETFDGTIWALAVPEAVISLTKEIEAWQETYGEASNSPYLSESFGGYSYTKGSAAGGHSAASTWQAAFASRLNPYRKLRKI